MLSLCFGDSRLTPVRYNPLLRQTWQSSEVWQSSTRASSVGQVPDRDITFLHVGLAKKSFTSVASLSGKRDRARTGLKAIGNTQVRGKEYTEQRRAFLNAGAIMEVANSSMSVRTYSLYDSNCNVFNVLFIQAAFCLARRYTAGMWKQYRASSYSVDCWRRLWRHMLYGNEDREDSQAQRSCRPDWMMMTLRVGYIYHVG